MPVYEFGCEKCKVKWEKKLTFAEHSAIKDLVVCECGEKAFQIVAQLNFRLQGEGWFGRDGGNNQKGLGYEMTQTSMDKSKEDVLRMDDAVAEMEAKDNNRSEL
jgi:putative FmdB family regulatory protein